MEVRRRVQLVGYVLFLAMGAGKGHHTSFAFLAAVEDARAALDAFLKDEEPAAPGFPDLAKLKELCPVSGTGYNAATDTAYTAADWGTLRELKRAYDPDNVFGLTHNIPPIARPLTLPSARRARISSPVALGQVDRPGGGVGRSVLRESPADPCAASGRRLPAAVALQYG